MPDSFQTGLDLHNRPPELSADPGSVLTRELARHDDVMRLEKAALEAAVREKVDEPLEQAFQEALHLLGKVRSSEEVDTARQMLRENLLPHLIGSLGGIDLVNGISSLVAESFERLERSAALAPERVERFEPPDLYEPDPKDSTITSLRKSATRLARKWPNKSDSRVPLQSVQLRELLLGHARDHFLLAFGRLVDDDRQHRARLLADVEREVSGLCHALMTVEADPSDITATLDRCEGLFRIVPGSMQSVVRQHAAQAFDSARSRLARDLRLADSFMAPPLMTSVEGGLRRLDKLKDEPSKWQKWQEECIGRLQFCRDLLAAWRWFQKRQDSIREDINTRLIEPFGAPIEETIRQMEKLASETASHLKSSAIDTHSMLQHSLSEGLSILESKLTAPLSEVKVANEVELIVERASNALAEKGDWGKQVFVLHLPVSPDVSTIEPGDSTVEMRLGEYLALGVDPLVHEQIPEILEPLRDQLRQLRGDSDKVKSVLSFNLGAAQEENSEDGSEMAISGYKRTLDALATVLESIRGAESDALEQLTARFLAAWTRVHERARAQRQLTGQLLDIRSRLDQEAVEISGRAFRHFRVARIWAERLGRRGLRRTIWLIRRGREAVGTSPPSANAYEEAAEAIADLHLSFERVPAVYRKLFSFQPVSDPELLIGRSADLAFIKKHLSQWERGISRSLVMTGLPGAGRTSFLNVVASDVFSAFQGSRINLEERIREESELVRILSSTLDLGQGDKSNRPQTLLELAARIRSDSEFKRYCLVERLESLMIRRIGGCSLLAGMLSFMSSTDSQIIWIGSMSDFGWQVFSRVDPGAAALVVNYRVDSLGREALEQVIISRHARSGIPLQFAVPNDPGKVLERRLKKAGSERSEQEILRSWYFDRLFAQAGESITVALYQWIRSLHMDDDQTKIYAREPVPFRFSYMARYSLAHLMVLKAFLEHETLTVQEYTEIDDVPAGQAQEMFESLGNELLIEPASADAPPSGFRFETVDPALRYRIRPLLTHAVIALLGGRNIVH